MSEQEQGGDAQQTGTGGTTAATTQTQTGGDAAVLSQQLNTEKSANALIKDFAKSRGVTVADLLKQFETAENSQKTELQRALDQAKDLERKYAETATELQRERVEKAIRDAAASAGARSDRLAVIYRAVREDVQYGEDGKPVNVAALIDQAKADAPEFFQAVSGSGDGGKGSGQTGSDPNAAINAAIRQAATA